MTMFMQRSLIIFVILLCCYKSWVDAVDCEAFPNHPDCRGSQARKRMPIGEYTHSSGCDGVSCKLPRMKLLIALLNDNFDLANEILSDHQAKRQRRKPRIDDMILDTYSDEY